jgi:hypothetical protein
MQLRKLITPKTLLKSPAKIRFDVWMWAGPATTVCYDGVLVLVHSVSSIIVFIIIQCVLKLGMLHVIQVTGGNGLPAVVSINNVMCEVTTTPAPAILGLPAPALRLKNGRIMGADGKEVFLHGINYIGYEYAKTFFDGLTGGRNSYHIIYVSYHIIRMTHIV